jgi:HEAT repeat protein
MIAASFALAAHGVVWAEDEVSDARLDEAFAGLRAWSGGHELPAHKTIRAYVERATAVYKVRVDAERRLIDLLEANDAPKPAKIFAAEQLYRLCDEDTVPAFVRLLARPDTWDLACTGLEGIKHPKAGQALIDAAASAKGDRLIGIIDSLGNRHDPAAVSALRTQAEDGDARTTQAALTAMGKIPGPEAMRALDWCRKNLSRKMRPAATQAYLQSGQTSLASGDTKTAIALFEGLLLDFEPVEVQAEGLRALIKARGDAAVPTIIEGLTSGIPELEAVAAAEAHTVPGRKATEAFIAAYPDLTNENQAVLLRALGERRDEAALPTVLLAAQSRVPTVRLAALDALGRFNHPDAVQVLLKAAVAGPADEQALARAALDKLDHPLLNDQLLVAAMSADNTVRAEAIKALAARGAHGGVPVLLRIAERDVKSVRLEALKALGKIGSVAELAPMVGMLTNEWTDEEGAAIGEAIIAVARRSPEGKTRTDPIGKALTGPSLDEGVRLSLVSILGAIADDASLPALESVAKKPGGRVQRAAVETLAGWPTIAPLDTLDRVARADKDPAIRSVAIDGALRQLERNPAVPEAQRLKYFENLAAVAQTLEQKERIAQGLAAMSSPDAEKLRQKLTGGA